MWDGNGTNFSLFSENAEQVELCLFDGDDTETRVELTERTASESWHGYVPGICGPRPRLLPASTDAYAPEQGHRFNPAKLASSTPTPKRSSEIRYGAASTLPYLPNGTDDADLHIDASDDAAAAIPKSIVVDTTFDWDGDDWRRPRVPWHETVIYEVHVKGFANYHPGVRDDLRGTYAGLASEASIAHLKSLGITAIELLPVHAFVDEQFLDEGLTNYWGYHSIGFFAPDVGYRAGAEVASEVRQFKEMVKALHAAGIEVILDVVYNHTAEGNHLGPDAEPARHRQPDLLPPRPWQRAPTISTPRARGTPSTCVTRDAPADVDSLRYCVLSARGRVPLRPRGGAGARPPRRRPALELLRRSSIRTRCSQVKLSPSPGTWAPAATRWAISRSLGGVERPFSDTLRDFWRGRRHRSRSRVPGHGASATSTRTRAQAVREDQLRHGPRRLHLWRSVSYNEKHNEANGEGGRTAPTTTARGTAASRGRPRPRDQRAAGAAARNIMATLLFSAGDSDDAPRGREGPHAGGNNNGCTARTTS